MDSDETIMFRVKNGELSELGELFNRYHVRMYNFFFRLTFDKALSQDMTQNLFYRIITYRHTFAGKGNGFRSWIYQVARNVHADHYRKSKRLDHQMIRMDTIHEEVGEENEEFREENIKKLESAMKKLDPEKREILVLSRFEGMKYEEISRIKNITVPAIKTKVHRAIKELRQAYFNT